jgi:membrane protein YqaA with SNARE-associated domain
MKRLRALAVSWGPLGVFLFSIIDSAGVPNPGGTDALLLVVTMANPASWILCAGLAVLGAIIGSVIFVEVLRRGGERYLVNATASGRGLRFRVWFRRYGLVTVFVPALLPVPFLPFKAFAACAAAMGVSRTRFLLVILAARIPRYFALAYLGATLGENSGAWITGHLWQFGAAAVALFIGLFLLVHFSARTRTE